MTERKNAAPDGRVSAFKGREGQGKGGDFEEKRGECGKVVFII
jgi:hypothetical protein